MRDQLDRPHLVEADHDTVLGFGSVERQDALGLLGEIGIRAPLPGARALMTQTGSAERLTQRLLTQRDPQAGEMLGELGQRPSRQRDALGIGAGARDRDDAVALLGRSLFWVS